MATTVTTSTSWFSRLGSSVKNVFFGFLLISISVILLFWNEGRTANTYQSLKEGASLVVSVSSETRNEANEGKLIHFSGLARTPSILTDIDFGVSSSALKLRRTVEMYQWIEQSDSKTVEKLGGGTDTTTTYTYKKDWSNSIVDSSDFKEAETHQNPTSRKYEDKELVAQNVSVGAYTLSEDLIKNLSGYLPLTLTQEMLNALPYAKQQELELVGSMIYSQTNDTSMPEIGNTRIRYEIIVPQTVSVIAKQTGDTLMPFITKNGRTISMIQLGDRSAAEMFAGAVATNKTATWLLRGLGTLLMYIGFMMILGVLPIIASVIPFVGRMIGAGTSIVSFGLTVIISSITIAMAWLVYRPFVSLLILGFGALGVILLSKIAKKSSHAY
ncbi:MAG: TMEM43 family protein [Patescibacteria group bacterium]